MSDQQKELMLYQSHYDNARGWVILSYLLLLTVLVGNTVPNTGFIIALVAGVGMLISTIKAIAMLTDGYFRVFWKYVFGEPKYPALESWTESLEQRGAFDYEENIP